MKQHITEEQLNELSDKAKERLGEWWKLQYQNHKLSEGDPILYLKTWGRTPDYFYVDRVRPKHTLPLLSIGEMIEFLDENYKDIRINHDKNIEGFAWQFCHYYQDIRERGYRYHNRKPELCDALWEAVKEVLEKE